MADVFVKTPPEEVQEVIQHQHTTHTEVQHQHTTHTDGDKPPAYTSSRQYSRPCPIHAYLLCWEKDRNSRPRMHHESID